MKAESLVRLIHYDLFMKFDKTTDGVIEPCDILSIPEDKLSTTISG